MTSKTRRLARLFAADGKCLVVAMDHAGFMDKPLNGLERPDQVIQAVVPAGADAFLLTLGSAQRCAKEIGRAGVWLSVDAQPPLLERIVETALRIGVDGIKCMVYPWCDDVPNSLGNFSALAADCEAWGMPLMAEVIPGGFSAGPEARVPEKISAGARVAMEAGADVIKTFYTGDADSFHRITRNCAVPIIVLGGERVANDQELLLNVQGALDAGAAGVAIGRNIWGHTHPGEITRALATLIHFGVLVQNRRATPIQQLVGVADVVSDYRIKTAVALGIPVFASLADRASEMREAGIPITGTLDDLLKRIDVIVDATPAGIGAKNLPLYRAAGVKAIYQGGEKHALTGHSFVAQANYETALGRDATRVVSCNTTATVRTLGALKKARLLKKARGVLIRRASDPWEAHKEGIMNTLVPDKNTPSHQGPDAKTVMPDLDVVTLAAKAAHNSSHGHFWIIELTRQASKDEALAAFRAVPRIAFIRMSDGIAALNSTVELMSDLGRPRGDMQEVAIWEDVLTVTGDELYYTYQVYNQAIVTPENIDAIRALSGIERDGTRSIEKTDRSLGIVREFLPSSRMA